MATVLFLAFFAFACSQTVRIAIHSGLCAGGETATLDSQLDNPNLSGYSFTHTLVDNSVFLNLANLQNNFDVILLATSQTTGQGPSLTAAAATNIANFVASGRGVIVAPFIPMSILDSTTQNNLAPVVPFLYSTSGACFGPGVTPPTSMPGFTATSTGHPIFAFSGLSFSFDSATTVYNNGIRPGFTSIGNLTLGAPENCQGGALNAATPNEQGVLVGTHGTGRIAYVPWPVCGTGVPFRPSTIRTGDAGRIFETALFWASGLTPICAGIGNGCNGGSCIRPNICDCSSALSGYTGPFCSTPICSSPCQNGGTCTAPETCSCTGTGYTGPTCNIPVCSSPCQNGGTCTAPETCSCTGTGYTGATCTTPICDTPACVRGSCVAPNTCDCSSTLPLPGYTGPDCNTALCDPGHCMNGGVCGSTPNSCVCPMDFVGLRCEQAVCSPVCQHGGTCVANTPSNTCDCSTSIPFPGFMGTLCQTAVCETGFCLNGGTCGGAIPNVCSCPATYSGNNCGTPVCTAPCAHGTCSMPDFCDCTGSGYNGTLCELPICTLECLNNSTCTAPEFCDCPPGWGGQQCELEVTSTTSSVVFTSLSTDTLPTFTVPQTSPSEGGGVVGLGFTNGVDNAVILFIFIALIIIAICCVAMCICSSIFNRNNNNKGQAPRKRPRKKASFKVRGESELDEAVPVEVLSDSESHSHSASGHNSDSS